MMRVGGIDYVQPINWQHPLSRGLAGWWLPITEVSANSSRLMDIRRLGSSGAHIHATKNGSPSFNEYAPNGFPALVGNSTSKNATVANGITTTSELTIVGGLTLAAWVKVLSAPVAKNWGIICKGTSGGGQNYAYFINASRIVGWRAFTGSVTVNAVGQTALTLGQWYHCVVTQQMYSGAANATISFYLNGKYDGGGTVSGVGAANNSFVYLGGGADGNDEYFDGSTNSHAIWRRALEPKEVSELYKESINGYPGLLRRLKKRAYSFIPASTGNRRRRVICGS